MFGNLTDEEIRQAFIDIADEMEKECENWKSLPKTDADRALKERILKIGRKLNEKRNV